MAKLIYFIPASLDGYISGENGDYEWSNPGDEVHGFINDLQRPFGTHLCGRKVYETMSVWATPEVIPGLTPAMLDFAKVWQAADKIVYSKTLESVTTPNTRLEREFDPQAVRALKAQWPQDASIGGPALAAHAIRAGLVDEYQLLIVPTLLGGGRPILPSNVTIKLELLEERRFANGWVYLRYRPRD